MKSKSTSYPFAVSKKRLDAINDLLLALFEKEPESIDAIIQRPKRKQLAKEVRSATGSSESESETQYKPKVFRAG